MLRLAGKVILVTGANAGVERALSLDRAADRTSGDLVAAGILVLFIPMRPSGAMTRDSAMLSQNEDL